MKSIKLSVPHVVQYQGSKRILAPQILRYMPKHFKRMVEPFAGSAAMTIAAASEMRAESYLVNDLNGPLVGMLEAAVSNPDDLLRNYAAVWEAQFSFPEGHLAHFYAIRDNFNSGDTSPANMLYLLSRCVKGSVRYGRNGNFNQSPDKRRHGTSPSKLAKNLERVSALLNGKSQFSSIDYREVFERTDAGDVVYMDPPYQGVSDTRDCRYLSGVSFNEFAEALDELNRKGIDFLISYDGACGGREYGQNLPAELGCRKVMLEAGLSSQALLLGRRSVTYEALYVSKGLIPLMPLPCVKNGQSAHEPDFFPEAASW
ncbi:MAG: DNA adenine methylase [Kiritimatiellae bacterium]|nr:DNA adenine methylase [Kiritimatiellia bacterium]